MKNMNSKYKRIIADKKWKQQGGKCFYCDNPMPHPKDKTIQVGWLSRFTLDHVVPRAAGGTNALTNLVAACRRCNQAKAAMTVEEWRAGHPSP